MIRRIWCEHKKTRRRYVGVTALAITAAMLAWIYPRNRSADLLRLGWMANLYELPLVNAVFMPMLAIVTASRLCDIEHKNGMLRQLAVIEKRGAIYDAKLLYGLTVMLFHLILSWGVTVAFGYHAGFAGEAPIKLYLLYLLFTAVPTAGVYIFQHTLSLCLKNQAVPCFIGIIGAFFGVFSMFLPQLPWLRKFLLWGSYGALSFVGLLGWTPDTRYRYAYYDVLRIDWPYFAVFAVICIGMYAAGRIWFSRKEL